MPRAFEDCVDAGGKVRTKSLPENQYVRGCKEAGKKWVWGEVLKKKTLRGAHQATK